jgi:hypothetical protein
MIGRGVIQECCLSPILFNLCSECFTKEVLEGFVELKIRGKIINSVKYSDDFLLLAKEEMVLHDMIYKLFGTGRSYGMEMNVTKNKSDESF